MTDNMNPAPPPTVVTGHYQRKQLECRSRVIAWSHGSRYQLGLKLVGREVPRLLDYGCGDGTFLMLAADRVGFGCGADLAVDQVADCRTRLAVYQNLHFCTTGELVSPSHSGTFNVVTCMETLEHCPASVVETVLRDLAKLVAPNGRVIISVPIETGPAFVLKAIIRKWAAWRGLSDYRHYESYTPRDALRMILAGRSTMLVRPSYGTPDAPMHSHYGFNWQVLRERVRAHLRIERTLFSPLGFLGGWASSQAWFVCRPLATVGDQTAGGP